jgi:hypothetical protein
LLQLTNDFFDDRYPQFVGRSNTQVVFTSNRLSDSLTIADKGTFKNLKNDFGIYLHDGNPKLPILKRLADSLGVVKHLSVNDDNHIGFLSEEKSIRNLYIYSMADSSLQQYSAYSNNLQDIDANIAKKSITFLSSEKGQEYIGYINSFEPINNASNLLPTPQAIRNGVKALLKETKPEVIKTEQRPTIKTPEPIATINGKGLARGEVDTDHYVFDVESVKITENRKPKEPEKRKVGGQTKVNKRNDNYKISSPNTYEDVFTFNNSSGNIVTDPLPMRGIGWQQTIAMNDMLENHLGKAGLFVTPNLKNTDWFGEYHYLPKRIDYSIRYDRRTIYHNNNDIAEQRFRFNQVAITAAYPLSSFSKISLSPTYTQTRSIDLINLTVPNQVSDYLSGKAEYVFDNTTTQGVNQLEGTRIKATGKYYHGLRSANESFYTIKVDIRNYFKVHKELVLATRLSLGHSGGNAPKTTTLGGMDNWLFINRDSYVANDALNPVDKRDLFFTEFATSMRGFNINKTAGTNHILFNAELRLPIAKYLYHGPITSNFLRNFQMIAFTDIGTAWTKGGPWEIHYEYPIVPPAAPSRTAFFADVNTFKSPFLIGYGLGARTMVLGYFLKFDVAWGMENKAVNQPISYLTLGYDF